MNGVWWGLAIGAGAGFFGTMVAAHRGARLDTLDNIALPAMIAGPLVGAAVGGAVDRSRTAREAIYVRAGSASHRRGLSWRWTAERFDVSLGVGF